MAILSEYSYRDFLAMDESRGELLGLLAECLAFLRTVDTVQADPFRVTIVEYIDGVAVENGDDRAGEVSEGGIGKQKEDGTCQKEPWQHA